ncbi:MAG TPA: DinB family protein [Puia sp.]|jgi:uncharacterized damage-inducible protein DinB|nr:DinB family protein [Puia sp.]
MRKIILLASVIIATSFITHKPETLTAEERKFAIDYFNKTKERLLNDVKGLSAAQLNFKADSTRWSVAQCVEHIALAETLIWQYISATVKQPPTPEKKSQSKYTDEQLIQLTIDRSKKFKAPEPLQPVGKFANTDEALKYYTNRRDSTIAYIGNTQDDLKNHYLTHPVMGTLNLYQALLLIAAHSERHTLQLEEVKANPNFPKQ